jgi:hypothetical protein
MMSVAALLFTFKTFFQPVLEQTQVASNVMWCESGMNYKDGVLVLQTAINRSKKSGTSLISALKFPRAYATACPNRPMPGLTLHTWYGLLASMDALPSPQWSKRAFFYCGPSDRPENCHDRRSGYVGSVLHDFYMGYIPRKRL